MLILGIETTCDETAAAIVENGADIHSHVIASQIKVHQKYGGVYPELASRLHFETILPIIDKSIKKADISSKELDFIAVANGPGLIGALLIGLNVAKTLSCVWNIPFIGINHVEAHLYAAMMDKNKNIHFPALGVVLSGGHTLLVLIEGLGKYQLLGTTIDDAIGEAFDKVASLLGLPYPGGPALENLASKGDPFRYPFRAGYVKNCPYHFSFSGLKTKVLYTIKGQSARRTDPLLIEEKDKKDIAASFQYAAFRDVIKKANKAATCFNCKAIYLGGGVSNNQFLRKFFYEKSLYPLYWPKPGLSLDNAAMIAGLAYHKIFEKKNGDPLDLDVKTRLSFYTE